MSESLDLKLFLPVEPTRLYEAWLDSGEHGRFTGSPAAIDPKVGGGFSAWDGYISGQTLELAPFARIVQSWRTPDFPEESPDSRLELRLRASGKGTELRLLHTSIPDGQSEDYRQGWEDWYFSPMREYFSPRTT